MDWQGWLRRWDRRNQEIFDGEVPDAIRTRWHWDRESDASGCERLVARQRLGGSVVLDADGIESRYLGTRMWSWDRIAYVTWQGGKPTGLAVCLYGDPYVHDLGFRHRDLRVCRAMLDDCRTFVEEHGARVRNKMDLTPSFWWANEPEAQRDFNR